MEVGFLAMKPAPVLLATLLLSPAVGSAEQADTSAEITACVERNLPEPDCIRAVRITARDRLGAEQVTVVKMFGRRTEKGARQLLVRFLQPEDVRGTAFLILERDGENEMYFQSPEFEAPKRISGTARASTLFGTDYSYEDFEHLQGFHRPGSSRRLDDDSIGNRSVYVVESRSDDSAYERILTFVDKETCVALRMEMYEPGGRLRKELDVNPDFVRRKGPIWIANMALMHDLRDATTTQLLVDSTEQDVDLPEGMFSLAGLSDDQR
jgi:hypothetical protein